MVKPTESWPETAMEALKEIPPIKFRQWWGAVDAKKEEFMMMPVPFAHLTYTGGEECNTEEDCTNRMKAMQEQDMNVRKMPDIQYNFLIGGDGVLYEGRGWHTQSTKDPDFLDIEGKSVDIAFIGDYKDSEPPEKCMKVADTFIKYMADTGYLNPDFTTIPLSKTREAKRLP